MYEAVSGASLEQLHAEQARVQADKVSGRDVDRYSGYCFEVGRAPDEPYSKVGTFLFEISGGDATVPALIEGLRQYTPDGMVHWADMGAGRAVPMRQLYNTAGLERTAVDILEYNMTAYRESWASTVREQTPWAFSPEATPTYLHADVSKVELPRAAHLITAFEVIQYLDDPLSALTHWYNQLADYGIMVVGQKQQQWGTRSRFNAGQPPDDTTPLECMFRTLEAQQVPYVCDIPPQEYVDEWTGRHGLKVLAIQKKPQTELKVNAKHSSVARDNQGYKTAYYEPPSDGGASFVLQAA